MGPDVSTVRSIFCSPDGVSRHDHLQFTGIRSAVAEIGLTRVNSESVNGAVGNNYYADRAVSGRAGRGAAENLLFEFKTLKNIRYSSCHVETGRLRTEGATLLDMRNS